MRAPWANQSSTVDFDNYERLQSLRRLIPDVNTAAARYFFRWPSRALNWTCSTLTSARFHYQANQ
jgi:hypothetical protein